MCVEIIFVSIFGFLIQNIFKNFKAIKDVNNVTKR